MPTSFFVAVEDGHPGDPVGVHDLSDFTHGLPDEYSDGVNDHSRFGFFYFFHLKGLFLEGHILVDDADSTLSGHGDGRAVLSDGVHGGADQGDVQRNIPGQHGGKVDIVW